jgi:hypothetical protein
VSEVEQQPSELKERSWMARGSHKICRTVGWDVLRGGPGGRRR